MYRYVSPHEATRSFDPKIGKYWLPVDQYTGGVEHAILHLMYARFWTKVMRDLGLVPFAESLQRLFNQGIILGEDGEKMSKSRGNVVNPDEFVQSVGADTVRAYLMFIGPWDGGGPWNSRGIDGMYRFLKRVWKLFVNFQLSTFNHPLSEERLHMMHLTIKGITEDMENLRFNTSIAKLMTYYNFLAKQPWVSREEEEVYVKLLAPFAPHMTEELWALLGNAFSIHTSEWPVFDEKYLKQDTVTIAVQINGKLRGTIVVAVSDKDNKVLLEKMAREDEHVIKFLEGTVRKVILVPGKILNFVI